METESKNKVGSRVKKKSDYKGLEWSPRWARSGQPIAGIAVSDQPLNWNCGVMSANASARHNTKLEKL